MAVINTNYLALVSQNNLNKSQSALGQAIERLSSGLRINSAKDDAAGQAIANRFTANIKGLTQAARNSNDGISAAQTTEGALNEINNNLQRIRELSVQAANGSNSDSDLQSIQDEINQRLDEIDRVAKQTTFNGRNVLDSNGKLTIQVGSQDSEVIDINLRTINRGTLGLTKLNMENQFVSKNAAGESNFTAFTGTLNGLDDVATVSNTIVAGQSAQWAAFQSADISFTGFQASYDGLVVGSDNKLYAAVGTDVNPANNSYYAATYNPDTGEITVASTSTALTVANSGPSAAFDAGVAGGGYVALSTVGLSMIPTEDPTIGSFYLLNSAGGTQLWAEISGTYYQMTGSVAGGFAIDKANSNAAAQGSLITSATYLAAFGVPSVTLDISGVAATLGADSTKTTYVQNANGDQFVQVSDGAGNNTYYAATFNSTTGAITLTNGSTAVATAANMSGVDAMLSGTNTLVTYADRSGYFVQNGTGSNATYYAATVGSDGTVALADADGNAAADPADAQVMVDPLAALDNALQQVDSLRSELGAVQNRFESTITNLNNTINNLSAARSRIEDADYAIEVSNMTRAQILQQAGTAVLAQANQVPQTMLSLLR